MCNNKEKGCNWVGELRSLESHLSTCDYTSMSCKYAAVGCEEKPLRKDLSEHENDSQLHLQITIKKVLELDKNVLKLTNMVQELTKVNAHLLKPTSPTPSTLKLTDYQQWKISGEQFYSPPFYTSFSGYKMCLEVYANGWGEGAGTHVSVFTHLMKGDHDDTLTWPFTWVIKVELLSRFGEGNHHKKTTTFPADNTETSGRVVNGEIGAGYGWPQFISHHIFKSNWSNHYLKDDSLVFRVSVQVPNHKPWLDCTV